MDDGPTTTVLSQPLSKPMIKPKKKHEIVSSQGTSVSSWDCWDHATCAPQRHLVLPQCDHRIANFVVTGRYFLRPRRSCDHHILRSPEDVKGDHVVRLIYEYIYIIQKSKHIHKSNCNIYIHYVYKIIKIIRP